jgi:hypothetical protein
MYFDTNLLQIGQNKSISICIDNILYTSLRIVKQSQYINYE